MGQLLPWLIAARMSAERGRNVDVLMLI